MLAAEVQPAFDAAAVQAELREQQPDVIAAAQAFSAPDAVRICIDPSRLHW